MILLNDARTWLYHLGDVSDERAAEIGATNADLVVTEWADYSRHETPYSAERIDLMRGGDDKLIVSYISIGEAEPYRYYWQEAWESEATRPDWIGEANPEWVDNIRVRYWDPDWQEIIFDYAERIVDQGFNGLYLDIVSAYEFWEKKDRAPGVDLRTEMADFVAALRAVVEARLAEVDPQRDFVIIGQNALELIREATYLDAIDGIAREDLRFYYEYGAPQTFSAWPRDEYKYHLNLLQKAEAAGKATFVVEYIPEGKLEGARALLKAEAEDLGASGSPLYIGATRDLTDIAAQPREIENGVFPPLGGTIGEPPVDGEINGTAGPDTLKGTDKADTIFGRGGNDTIRAGSGNDHAEGGAGNDEIFGAGGRDRLFGGQGLDEIFGQSGRDRIAGGGGADLIEGGGGNDRIKGGKGSDEIFGGGGRDRIEGGAGGDYLEGGRAADIFVFRKGSGEDEIAGFDGTEDRLDIGAGANYDLMQLKRGLYLDFDGKGDGVLLIGVDISEFSADWLI
jgi:cysteinyl-tRNA synthetase